MIEPTDEMIYAFAGEPEITATDAHAIRVGLAAVLAIVERDHVMWPKRPGPFAPAAGRRPGPMRRMPGPDGMARAGRLRWRLRPLPLLGAGDAMTQQATRPQQGAVFEVPKKRKRNPLDDIVPLYAPGEPRPWDVIDAADQELGWEYRYVDHKRAVEIRTEAAA